MQLAFKYFRKGVLIFMIELKSGVKTSEFWLTVLALVAGVTDLISLPGWMAAALPAVYTLSRAWIKR